MEEILKHITPQEIALCLVPSFTGRAVLMYGKYLHAGDTILKLYPAPGMLLCDPSQVMSVRPGHYITMREDMDCWYIINIATKEFYTASVWCRHGIISITDGVKWVASYDENDETPVGDMYNAAIDYFTNISIQQAQSSKKSARS
jgi:hypothetical protein